MTDSWLTVWDDREPSISFWDERPDPDAYVGVGLFVSVSLLDEAIAAKERAEAELDETKKAVSLLDNETFKAMGQAISTLTAERDKAFAAQDRAEEWGYKKTEDIMTLGRELAEARAALERADAELETLSNQFRLTAKQLAEMGAERDVLVAELKKLTNGH